MSTTRDSKPHTIVVTRVDAETGETEWEVEHNDTCTQEFAEPENMDGINFPGGYYYTCAVQYDLDCIGLGTLATFLNTDELKIAPGRYEVVGVYSFDAYTREGDFWYEEPPK